MSILTLAGSPSRQSRSSALLRYAGDVLARHGSEVQTVGLRDIPAEDLIEARVHSPAVKILRAKVERAEALVLASPIYKASISGGLKAVLDLLPQDALAGKIVLPLATGGSLAHLLALEYGLKPVLSALGARTILPGVYAAEAQVSVDDGGSVWLDPVLGARLDEALEELRAALARRGLHASVERGGRATSETVAASAHTAPRDRSEQDDTVPAAV